MRRSLQEYVELVVFGLIALLVGTGLLWVVGWVLSLGGIVLKGLAGLLWMLLRFIVPVAIAGGLVYFLVKALQGRQGKDHRAADTGAGSSSAAASRPSYPSYTPPASTDLDTGAPVAGQVAVDVPSADPASDMAASPASSGGVTDGNVALSDDGDELAGEVTAGPLDHDASASDDDLDDELADELEDELGDEPEDDDRDRA